MNQRPSGYEPDELPDCSIPRYLILIYVLLTQSGSQTFLSKNNSLDCFSRQSIPRYLILIYVLLTQSGSQTFLSKNNSPDCFSRQSIPRYLIKLPKPYRHQYYVMLNLKNQVFFYNYIKFIKLIIFLLHPKL